MAFKLLVDSVNFEYGDESGQSGEATFVNADDGSYGSLPSIGDSFSYMGTTAASCVLRRIKMRYLERDTTRTLYQCIYNTPQRGTNNISPGKDVADRRWDFGGDMQSIQKPDEAGWSWQVGSASSIPIGNVPIPIRVLMINYTRPTKELDDEAGFKGAIKEVAGYISSDDWDGWGEGNVLCTGASGGSFRNEFGETKFRFEVGFSVRLPTGKTTEGWQYLLRPDGVWDMPVNAGSVKMYGSVGFGTKLNSYF